MTKSGSIPMTRELHDELEYRLSSYRNAGGKYEYAVNQHFDSSSAKVDPFLSNPEKVKVMQAHYAAGRAFDVVEGKINPAWSNAAQLKGLQAEYLSTRETYLSILLKYTAATLNISIPKCEGFLFNDHLVGVKIGRKPFVKLTMEMGRGYDLFQAIDWVSYRSLMTHEHYLKFMQQGVSIIKINSRAGEHIRIMDVLL